MMKKCLFAVILLSLALVVGCAKGGNGTVPPPPPEIDVSNQGPNGNAQAALYPNQTITFTATVGNPPEPIAVTWSLSGSACTGSPNPCGTIDATSGVYQAPATPPTPSAITITATATANSAQTGTMPINLVYLTTYAAPFSLSVGTAGGTGGGGTGLTQQFTAVALPNDAPQTFTWTCTANGVPCTTFSQDSSVSALAYYTANDSCGSNCVQIQAFSTLDPTGVGCATNPKDCTIAKASLVPYRVQGTYAFRFSGYDSSNHPTAVVGTFTISNGTVTSGTEEELTSSGFAPTIPITGGSYAPTSADPNNSNNAGTLTLTLPAGVYPNQYQVVLNGSGGIEMIESDGQGTGSGVAQKSSSTTPFTQNQTYAFGFTGVDASGSRVGYVGVLPTVPGGTISGGQMDVNDNGNDTNICGAGPCSVSGSYTTDACNCGLYHMTLTAGSNASMKFDSFISSGGTSKSNPLTFYAISTDFPTNPAVSGTMVLQDSTQTYNIAAFNSISVSALTGAGPNGTNTNVSLTLAPTDGNGDFSGQFDQNNAGTILTVPTSGSAAYFQYTYAASTSSNGRYTFQMLGNPDASPVVPPLPFILYASGANRGFLLDQNSSSVMTGTMTPQGGDSLFGTAEMQGTYAAATTSSGVSAVIPIAANLVLTSTGGLVDNMPAGNVAGTQYRFPSPPNPGRQTVAGGYTLTTAGVGAIPLTAPAGPSYVVYVVDTSGPCNPAQSPVCSVQDFFMIDENTKNPNASVIFAQQ